MWLFLRENLGVFFSFLFICTLSSLLYFFKSFYLTIEYLYEWKWKVIIIDTMVTYVGKKNRKDTDKFTVWYIGKQIIIKKK